MSSSSPIEMEESSDTSREDRSQKTSRLPHHDELSIKSGGPRRNNPLLYVHQPPVSQVYICYSIDFFFIERALMSFTCEALKEKQPTQRKSHYHSSIFVVLGC